MSEMFGYFVAGGIQDALTERYNDQLRELRAAGLTETAADLREAVLQLRDEERAPLEAVQVSIPHSKTDNNS